MAHHHPQNPSGHPIDTALPMQRTPDTTQEKTEQEDKKGIISPPMFPPPPLARKMTKPRTVRGKGHRMMGCTRPKPLPPWIASVGHRTSALQYYL